MNTQIGTQFFQNKKKWQIISHKASGANVNGSHYDARNVQEDESLGKYVLTISHVPSKLDMRGTLEDKMSIYWDIKTNININQIKP